MTGNKICNQIQSVAVIIGIIGTIGALILSTQVVRLIFTGDFMFLTFIVSLIPLLLGIFITYLMMMTIGEFLNLLETIKNNSNVNSRESLTTSHFEYKENKLSDGQWRCSDCSTVNAKYVGTCKCGASK
ncbi:MAG: hypothetical protein CVU98_04965 [Firmicutes bacterium HGW-Firmicutes-3]|nr:MAG: hypothetical protein CVU98_04965 [Firmicutes bacterium HGW-Firmicutes-3]